MGTVEGLAGEVIDEIDQLVPGQLVVLVEVDLAGEDTVEVVRPVGIGPLDGEHGVVEIEPEQPLDAAGDLWPGGGLRDDEMVVLWVAGEEKGLLLGHPGRLQLGRLVTHFLVETVVDALVEEQGEDIAAELRVVGVAAQDVGRLVEIGFELALGHPPRGADDDRRFQGFEQFFEGHPLLSVGASWRSARGLLRTESRPL